MLSTFTTENGTLIIRTEDIRRIEDVKRHHTGQETTIECMVEWYGAEGAGFRYVIGTARENLERLQREEFAAMEQMHAAQRRLDRGMPALPVPRGAK